MADLHMAARLVLTHLDATGTLCAHDESALLLRIALQEADLARVTAERDEAAVAAAALRSAVETLTAQIRDLQAAPVSSPIRLITLRKE